jgi:hypothetical protein
MHIALLGAEKQAAVSAALAWPELPFLFVTDQPVVDGWDLPNVTFSHGVPGRLPDAARAATQCLALCARWATPNLPAPANALGAFDLLTVLGQLRHQFGDVVLPVTATPPPGSTAVVKGNRWHRPDAPVVGAGLDATEIPDPGQAGVVFQEHWPAARHLLATGRRTGRGQVDLAVFHVRAESCARDDVLAAAETVCHDRLGELSVAILDHLDHRGFATLNWLERDGAVRLTSYRPTPRAVFRTLRQAGLDLFGPTAGVRVARPGLRFTVDIHYSSYQRLPA